MSAAGLTFRLLGQGIAYSASPAMMNAAFAALGLPHRYVLEDVAAEDVPAAVARLRDDGTGGANVTVPHKAAVAALVDELSSDAARGRARSTSSPVTADGCSASTPTCPRPSRPSARSAPDGRRACRRARGGWRGPRRASWRLPRYRRRTQSRSLRRSDGSMRALAEPSRTPTSSSTRRPVGTAQRREPGRPAALLRPDLAVLDLVYRPSPTRLVRERASGRRRRGGGRGHPARARRGGASSSG